MTQALKKPHDLGDGFTCASYLDDGHWLAITRPHAKHGMVELTGAAEFDDGSRGNQQAVRRYRQSLTTPESAFLTPSASSGISVVSRGVGDDGSIWLRMRVEPSHRNPISLRLTFQGWLQRPPYAEITDTAPLPPLSRETSIAARGSRLLLSSDVTESTAEILVKANPATSSGWVLDHNGEAHWEGQWPPSQRGDEGPEFVVTCRLDTPWDPPYTSAGGSVRRRLSLDEGAGAGAFSQIAQGARSYILQCCALRVAADETVIITDHRLLPLSWTRDGYYMALLLMLSGGDDATAVVGRHLRWLWGRAFRDGVWMRSHLTNGAVKDPGLQADQQLYPILELLDFRRALGRWPTLPAGKLGWGELVWTALSTLPSDPTTGLLISEENPADDTSRFHLSFSTQVLYWHVIKGLAEWSTELGLDADPLNSIASDLRDKVSEVFTVNRPDGTLFAYEADGRGGYRLYGDANDLPSVLAPAWGFCTDDDAVWRRTMRFILSPSNPGWSPGPFGGLGSAHTPGTWPLGDLQSYLFHDRVGESDEARTVRERLVVTAAGDGLLPEAYDSVTGEWSARHWFGWPAAAVGCLAYSRAFTVAAGGAQLDK